MIPLIVLFCLALPCLAAPLPAQAPPPAQKHLLATYSWGVTNIGDIAITPGFLSLLRDTRPELPLVVMTYQRANNPSYATMNSYLSGYLPGVRTVAFPFPALAEKSTGEPGSAWRAFHDRWGPSKLRAFENGTIPAQTAAQIADDALNRLPREIFAELQRTNPEAARAFTDAGFVMYTSGMVLNFGRSGIRDFYHYTLRNAMSLLVARSLGIPYGINGHSFESIDWPADLVLQPLLQDAQFVYCRDPDSVEFLRQKKIVPKRTGFRPDTTFFFQGFDESWAQKFMQDRRLTEKKFIVVVTRNGHSQRGAVARTISPEREQAQMATMRKFITDWVGRTGQTVVLCPEVKSEIPWAKKHVLDLLPAGTRRHVINMEEFPTTEQAYSLYRRAEMVVSMEMHSVIMAYSLGTPALLPEFTENGRKGTMLGEMRLADWHIDIDEPDSDGRILTAALAIHQDPNRAAARVREQLPRLRELGASVVTDIDAAWRR